VDSLHTVGDILTKISTNCVINLHVALLFTCLFYGFIICVVITIWNFLGISCICCMPMFIVITV
jgi:surface polysaccharide O-acyltransferase-like enzyme